jgi:Carbohydrate binding domain
VTRSTLVFTFLLGWTSVLATGASICDGIAGNIVTNCGFETGDFTGWTAVDGSGNTFVAGAFDTGPNSGNSFAALGAVGTDGTVSQTLTTIPGQTYDFSFWLASDGGLPNDFTAQWDGADLVSLAATPATPYVLYSFIETASSTSTAINFIERNDPGFWGLDDVSVVATPEPSNLVESCLLVGLMVVVYKRRRVPVTARR